MATNAPRGMLEWAGAALAGGMSAAAFAIALAHAETVMIFIAYLAPLPLFVAGLASGAGPAILAAIVGIGGVAAAQADMTIAIVYACLNAIPVTILICLALRTRVGTDGKTYWYPEGHLLTAITIYPCLVFLALAALSSGYEGGLLGQIKQAMDIAADPLTSEIAPDMAGNVKPMLNIVAQILPFAVGLSWLCLTLISLVIGQTIVKQQNWNRRPDFNWLDIQISNTVIMIAAATGLAAWYAPEPWNYYATNVCALLCLPFLMIGLSVVHKVTTGKVVRAFIAILTIAAIALPLLHAFQNAQEQLNTVCVMATILIVITLAIIYSNIRMATLVWFYIVLSLAPQTAIIVAMLGVAEQFFHFRQRLPQQTKTQGEDK